MFLQISHATLSAVRFDEERQWRIVYRNLFFCNTSTLSCLGNQVRLTKIIQQFYHFSSHSDKHHCDSCHASWPFLAAFWYLSQMTTEVKISICRSFARKVKFLSCLTQKRFKCGLWLAMRLATPSLSWGMPLKLKERNISTKHNRLGNPNWREAGQLAIYKLDWGYELGSTDKQRQLSSQSGTWICDLRAVAVRPRCLLQCSLTELKCLF